MEGRKPGSVLMNDDSIKTNQIKRNDHMKQLERQGPVRSKDHEAFLDAAMLGHRGGSSHCQVRVSPRSAASAQP